MKPMCARLLLAVVVPLAAADARAATTVRIDGTAGLAGLARAGRWMPIDVRLRTTDADIDGELVATWGDASVHHAVTAAAPSVTTIQLYLRTSDPRDRVQVELRTDGQTVATTYLPVRLVTFTDEVTVCLEGPGDADAANADCTARISPGALPRSPRGLEVADAIIWRGPEPDLAPLQRQALHTWRAYGRLLESDTGWAPRQVPRAQVPAVSQRARAQAASAGVAYVVMLVLASSWRLPGRCVSAGRYVAVTGVVLAATAGAVFAGQSSLAGPVHVRHATLVQQLDNGWSRVSARGTASFPAFAAYRLSADVDDGSIRLDDYPRHVYAHDATGHPVVAGTFGLGSSIPFDLEAYLPFAPLALERQGDQVRITNTSEATMRGCRVLSDFADAARFDLLPGASEAASRTTRRGPAIVSCTFTDLPIGFRDPRYHVESEGEVVINAFLPGEDLYEGAVRR